jgi:hypothetical protein
MSFSFYNHPIKLDVKNLDETVNSVEKKGFHLHGELFPNCVRALICGSSGTGKTNLVVNLLTNSNGLRFRNVYVYCKSLQQDKYMFLNEIFKGMKEIEYKTFSNHDEVVPVDQIKKNSVLIFDDCILENQTVIRDYFCRSRHKMVNCLYLTQSYTKLMKHLLRENTNVLVVFKQDQLALSHIFKNHVYPDMEISKFFDLAKICWGEKYGFLVICKDFPLNFGRYRQGFSVFIQIEPEK